MLSDSLIMLRPWREEDAPALYRAVRASLQDLIPWLSWAHADYSITEARAWIQTVSKLWREGGHYAFGVFLPNGELVGSCSLGLFYPQCHFANLGYWVHHAYRGQGIAVGAARLVARFGFEEVGLVRIEIVIAAENFASRRVAEKLGAHFEGILRNRLMIHKRPTDAAMYSLLPQDICTPNSS